MSRLPAEAPRGGRPYGHRRPGGAKCGFRVPPRRRSGGGLSGGAIGSAEGRSLDPQGDKDLTSAQRRVVGRGRLAVENMALMLDRELAVREASPTAGVIDSQSVKAHVARERGFDAGKKIVDRKRHIAVDTDGRLLMVNLTPADISDSAGA
jgi:hypothetical protein